MLAEYYFKIKYIKGTKNVKVDIFSRILKLQNNKKLLRAILKLNNNRRIKYNYLQLIKIYKALKLSRIKKI